jgi:2-polyprenyl-6-methoxyphenol hydroxylase-like FAD-dependent oxidoreductase
MAQSVAEPERLHARCCIVGGGPAGMMLGLLLARAGIDTIVLEKHADFLRDFRGDTIHPSTLELMNQLGILDEFLARPHQEARQLDVQFGDTTLTMADFTHLPTRCKFVAFMPQWDFLDFIAAHAKRFASFRLRMEAEATELIRDGERVVGVVANTPNGPIEVRAELVVGTDGRHSTVRSCAGLEVEDLGAPMDVLWMRVSRRESDPGNFLGRFGAGRLLVLIDRREYWQCAFVIRKGTFDEVRGGGLAPVRDEIARLVPFLRDRVEELQDWKQVSLLSVTVDRLRQWYLPGLLCIGDAAHAMSPIGGVGINLAIQDAVAAANILTPRFIEGEVTSADLKRVQHRRELPTRIIQGLQILLQNRVLGRVLGDSRQQSLPLALRLIRRSSWLRRLTARLIGIGFRPEHIKTPEVGAAGSIGRA